VAEEWMKKRMIPKSAESYLNTLRLRLNKLIFPFIGHMKLANITAGVILQLCRRIEDKGTIETASRLKQIIGQVFDYAIATSRAETNPTLALRGALQTRKKKALRRSYGSRKNRVPYAPNRRLSLRCRSVCNEALGSGFLPPR
jgi:hypothetical protein